MEFGILRRIATHYALPLFGAVLILTLGASPVLADSIRGILDFNYSNVSIESTDAAGNTTKTDSNNINPRFTLDIDKTIYPNLRLLAGVVAERIISDIKSDDLDRKITLTRIRPYLDLRLDTPFYNAGIGYNRREEELKTSGSPSGSASVTSVNEEYSAILGWKPIDFPSMELRYRRANNFDGDRTFLDINRDILQLISKYAYKGLSVDYQGTFTKTKDNIVDLETRDLINSARITYGNTFFNDRVSLYSTYNIAHQEVKTVTAGGGFVTLQAFPFAGLSAIDDTPNDSPLLATPALIDGDLTASTGINLGVQPDNRPRNIGLDFAVTTEVNQILVWVDRELPPGISNSFSWRVFTSQDNLTWALIATIPSAPFGQFQNRFEINFPNVTTRFIKVVVDPLTPAEAALVPGFPNPGVINVTELEAFVRSAAAGVQGKVKRTSHIYNLDTKTRILDFPTLYYDLSYLYNRVDPSGQMRWTLSNGFSTVHRFSRIFSTTASIAREDGADQDEKRVAYIFNSMVNADFLRTLRSSLALNGRTEETDRGSSSDYSVLLNNTAELYKGIDVNLNGGVAFTKSESGERQKGARLDFISTITPRSDLTLNLNYSVSLTRRSGGVAGNPKDLIQRGEIAVSYNPIRTLTLFGSMEVIAQTNENTRITKNYGLNWVPFPDGALQFNFLYNEELRSEDNGLNRIIAPTLRWNFTKQSYLDLTYQIIKDQSNAQKTDSKIISTTLKLFF